MGIQSSDVSDGNQVYYQMKQAFLAAAFLEFQFRTGVSETLEATEIQTKTLSDIRHHDPCQVNAISNCNMLLLMLMGMLLNGVTSCSAAGNAMIDQLLKLELVWRRMRIPFCKVVPFLTSQLVPSASSCRNFLEE